MKVISNRNNPRSDAKAVGFEMPSSLQHSLTTAIHGAFEVAVEIAVVEVTKLVSVAAGDMYEKIQQENETLKEELRKARSVIDSLCCEAGNSGEKNNQQLLQETNPAAAHNVDQFSPNRGKTEHNKDDGQCLTSHDNISCLKTDIWANIALESEQSPDLTVSHSKSTGTKVDLIHACGVKVERSNHSCMSEEADPPEVPLAEDIGSQFVKVKVENLEEIPVVKDVSVDSFKEDAISQLQSEIMQEWTPGASYYTSDEHDASLQAHSQANGHSLNMNFSLDTTHDSSSHLNLNLPICVLGKGLNQDPPPRYLLVTSEENQVQRNQKKARLGVGLKNQLEGKQLASSSSNLFQCPECNRGFSRSVNLKTHLRIHTGERPYKCAVCSTAFRHSGALTRHFRIHTGEKPYVCGLCGKSFRNYDGLKFHQRSHNKEQRKTK